MGSKVSVLIQMDILGSFHGGSRAATVHKVGDWVGLLSWAGDPQVLGTPEPEYLPLPPRHAPGLAFLLFSWAVRVKPLGNKADGKFCSGLWRVRKAVWFLDLV